MGEVKVILVEDTGTLVKTWGHYIEGVESVLKYSHGDTTVGRIYERILRGELSLWVVFKDNKYVGFYTTSFSNVPQGKSTLTVTHAYSKPGTPPECYAEGLKEIERMAEKYGCDIIRFWTIREKGFSKRMEKYGYKPAFVEFVKQLGGDG